MLRAERSKNWTALKAGLSPTTFQRKLNHEGDFTINELTRIARALGVHPASLLPKEFALSIAQDVAA
jgi:DNA-binding phage protein